MKITKAELFLYPLVLVIFFITFHHYKFYQNDFNKIFEFIPFSLKENAFESIQSYHPYALVRNALLSSHANNNRIYYLQTITEPKNQLFLRELTIMINYLSYPDKIPTLSLKSLNKTPLESGDTIIADIYLPADLITEMNLSVVPKEEQVYHRINRRMEMESYFDIYVVN